MIQPDLQRDYHLRQEAIITPEDLIWPIHIVGLGAVGSYAALILAKLGASNLHIYDNDRVMPENVANQLYGPEDVGQHKALALATHVQTLTGTRPLPNLERVESRRFEGVVILAVDSMSDRCAIFESSIQGRSAVRWALDVRLGFLPDSARTEVGLLFTLRPSDPAECGEYARSLHDDDMALPLDCRAAGVVYASVTAAGRVARRMKQIARGEPFALSERILP